eukprot:TRINITY_DN47398_c0_g1_i1.p1 TRINITY_DN47398_c0_g1~~TRINITY_DN47398_c0_g1_i1.p1  ORF type:complete len:339 (+),score=105.60 TRINITY_DN47398_c0_g1_i1:67-1017(+)
MAATAFGLIEERNEYATVHVRNLDGRCDEEMLWELMLQAGPLVNVKIPKDTVSSETRGFAFVEYKTEVDADYAIKVLNMVKLFGKPLRMSIASQNANLAPIDVGANVYIGGLDPDVDEKILHDTFSAFGGILSQPKVMRDPETGNSKGFGFINFDSYEAADQAIACMNNQFLLGRKISLTYALKKDGRERYGSDADRSALQQEQESVAAQYQQAPAVKREPNQFFSAGPGLPVTGSTGDVSANPAAAAVGYSVPAYDPMQVAMTQQYAGVVPGIVGMPPPSAEIAALAAAGAVDPAQQAAQAWWPGVPGMPPPPPM